MSRIGKKPVSLPVGVRVSREGGGLVVEGPKGRLRVSLGRPIEPAVAEGRVSLENRTPRDRDARALHGLARALLQNAVTGVTEGFEKRLEIVGVGWGARMQGKSLALTVGFSHPVLLPVPEGLEVQVPGANLIVVRGADRALVGRFTAEVRAVRPPEPYGGKGVRYVGERVRRKAGKAFATGAGAGGGS